MLHLYVSTILQSHSQFFILPFIFESQLGLTAKLLGVVVEISLYELEQPYKVLHHQLLLMAFMQTNTTDISDHP